jgi:prephenate dehydrogenase
MPPRNLSILGVGLLGGSIALAAREAIKVCRIRGYGHRPETLDDAKKAGVIDEGYADPASAVRGADLVILCSPVGILGRLLRLIGPALSAGAVVTDVGSTKRSVVEAAEQSLPVGTLFVGSHPMAGSEKRGVAFARADLCRGALCIVTPTDRTPPQATDAVESFWRLIGMRTTRMSPDEHDRRLADISHLPHALAAALVAMQDDASLPLAGGGFRDITRIAAGDAGLWRDIFLDNRDNLRNSALRLREQLDAFLERLDPERSDELRDWLDRAGLRRRSIGDGKGP